MVLCYVLAGALAAVVVLYWSFDLHYFLRMGMCVLHARLFKKKVHILDSTSVTGVCLSTDVDTLLYHMNNARYLRELDFARVDFYERTGLYRTICAKGGAVVQGSCTIRYRRFVRPFSLYTITSKIVYWDQNSIFMEHRFITPKDEFVRAIALCRQRLINVSAEDVMSEILIGGKLGGGDAELGQGGQGKESLGFPERGLQKLECPLEVLRWVESNEISSANLRNGC